MPRLLAVGLWPLHVAAGKSDPMSDELLQKAAVHRAQAECVREALNALDAMEEADAKVSAMQGDDAPVAAQIGALVDEGRAGEVAERLGEIWHETLREHLARGEAPPRPVVLAFHAIRAAA